jgi:predicted HTH domain antitoxin
MNYVLVVVGGRNNDRGQRTLVKSNTTIMIQIQLNLPESAFSALRSTPNEFGQELLIAAVVKWYEVGMISQSKAAEIAGISCQGFLQACDRFGVSPFQTTPEELIEGVNRG